MSLKTNWNDIHSQNKKTVRLSLMHRLRETHRVVKSEELPPESRKAKTSDRRCLRQPDLHRACALPRQSARRQGRLYDNGNPGQVLPALLMMSQASSPMLD